MSFTRNLLFLLLLLYGYRAVKYMLRTLFLSPGSPGCAAAMRNGENWSLLQRAYEKLERKKNPEQRHIRTLLKHLAFLIVASLALCALQPFTTLTLSAVPAGDRNDTAAYSRCLSILSVEAGEYCRASESEWWGEEVRDGYRWRIRYFSHAMEETIPKRHFFADQRGEIYYTHYALVRVDGCAPEIKRVLISENNLMGRLEEMERNTSSSCLCAPFLGLVDNITFLRAAQRWYVMHDAAILRNRSDSVVVKTGVFYPPVSPFRPFLPAPELVLHHHSSFTIEFTPTPAFSAAAAAAAQSNGEFILRRITAERITLQLSGDDATCFFYCHHLLRS
jgi:hypothetical protein